MALAIKRCAQTFLKLCSQDLTVRVNGKTAETNIKRILNVSSFYLEPALSSSSDRKWPKTTKEESEKAGNFPPQSLLH